MALIQCKMCGFMLELTDGMTVGECPACGSVTTFPKITSEHAEQLYARAEHFRQLNDFDKAIGAYEEIVRENPDDAEAYWGIVLSRFGIEYVEDPLTHERVPTCHRVQYESILADGDYKSALEHADTSQRDVYESEAKRIAEIQKGILAISAQEKPFDVFICYKETTDGGSRTKDSTIAQDIYYQLVSDGYKVFFSRITLEDKLGQQYEPYIFAALNSAKVMLVVGTKREYFNAVWVRNEWSRFLALMKKDRSRLLIPCYRDMDAYDIPEELSMLQSQDMSKIGFIQDLLRGIAKVLKPATTANEAGNAQAVSGAIATSASLLKRAWLFVRSDKFDDAIEYCDKVLDIEPENGEAYLCRLLGENKLKTDDDLYLLQKDLDTIDSFKWAMEFSDASIKSRLQAQVKQQRDERTYKELERRFSLASEIADYQKIADGFEQLGGYKESELKKQKCEKRIEELKPIKYEEYQKEYEYARQMVENGATADEWFEMSKVFSKIRIPEADEMVEVCKKNGRIVAYNHISDEKQQLTNNNEAEAEDWFLLEEDFESFVGDEDFPDAESEAHKCHEIGLKMGYDEAMRIKGECENDNKILIKGIKSDALSEARGHVLLVRSYYDDCREKFHQIIENLEYARTVFDKLGEYKDAAEQAKLILDFKSEIQYNMYNVEELISETKAKERYRQVRFWVLLLLILGVFFLVCLLLFGW